MQSSQPTID